MLGLGKVANPEHGGGVEMPGTLSVQRRFVIPQSPHAGLVDPARVAQYGLAKKGTHSIPVVISRRPTQLPKKTRLGDARRGFYSALKLGLRFLIGPRPGLRDAAGEIGALVAQGMIAPVVDLVAPGLSIGGKVGLHELIEDATGDARQKLYDLGTSGVQAPTECVIIPYADVTAIEQRELPKTFWNSAVNHISLSFLDTNRAPATLTILKQEPFGPWIDWFFKQLYDSEVTLESSSVIDSYIPNEVRIDIARGCAKEDISPEQLQADYDAARHNYLLSHGIAQEMLQQRVRDCVRDLMQRYRGLPLYDPYMESLGCAPAAATQGGS